MKKALVFITLLVSLIALAEEAPEILTAPPALSGLYLVQNPLDIIFRAGTFNAEAFYIPVEEDLAQEGAAVLLRLNLGPLAIGGGGLYSGYNLVEDLSKGTDFEDLNGGLVALVDAGLNLGGIVAAAYMPVPVDYKSGSMAISGKKLNLAVGLGGITKGWRYNGYRWEKYKKGGGAIYYINKGVMGFDENGEFYVNKDVDWLDAEVGIYSTALEKDSFAVLDMKINLNFFKLPEEERQDKLLNYLFATLQFQSGGIVLGATYNYGRNFAFDFGISLATLKGWVETSFDTNFNMLGWGGYLQLAF